MPCMLGASCSEVGLTLRTLQLEPGWWRVSANSTDLRPCRDRHSDSPGCAGGSGGDNGTSCKPGLTGPYCRLCTNTAETQYYNPLSFACEACDSAGVSTLVWVLIVVLLLLAAGRAASWGLLGKAGAAQLLAHILARALQRTWLFP